MSIRLRPTPRRWSHWYPTVNGYGYGDWNHRGGALALQGPAGPVSRGDTSAIGYNGMDPSDPPTWVRGYNPQPGMVARLNFDPFLGEEREVKGPRDLRYWQAPGKPRFGS